MDVFTDGSCLGNPGPGGWAFACGTHQESGGEAHTTNNRMELIAVQRALEFCRRNQKEKDAVTILTDSAYVKNGITKWIHAWRANGWRTASGGDVKNRDCWEALDALTREVHPRWKWVKAHDKKRGHPMNERVDRLAREVATCYRNNDPPR